MSEDRAVIHFDIQTDPVLDTYRVLAKQNPCAVWGHRGAWRVDGPIRCYYCNVRLT